MKTMANKYEAALPDVVYGGTYNFMAGTLTVTHRGIDLSTLSGWSKYANIDGTVQINISGLGMTVPGYDGVPSSDSLICSHLQNATRRVVATKTDTGIGIGSASIICIYAGEHSATVSDWTTYLAAQTAAGTPVMIVAKLANPLEYTLSTQQIETLLGENYVWSNGDDISELVYMFTDEIIINNEGMPAIPTINASEAGPTVTLRGASHVLAAGDNRFSDFVLQSGENVMQVEDPAGTLTIKYQEGML